MRNQETGKLSVILVSLAQDETDSDPILHKLTPPTPMVYPREGLCDTVTPISLPSAFSIPPGQGPRQLLNHNITVVVTSEPSRLSRHCIFPAFHFPLLVFLCFFSPIRPFAVVNQRPGSQEGENLEHVGFPLPLCTAQDCIIWYLQRNRFKKSVPSWCAFTWTLDPHALC